MNKIESSNKQVTITLDIFLVSLCFFFSIIENSIPKPIPFLRIGLANIPIILSLYLLPKRKTLFLLFIKLLGQNVISGTLFSYVFIFSFCGSLSSCLFMLLAYHFGKKHLSVTGISIIGAITNNLAQVFCSYAFVFKESTKYITPILLISGLVSGVILGLFTNYFMQNSKWFLLMNTNKTNLQSFYLPSDSTIEHLPLLKTTRRSILNSLLVLLFIVFFALLQPQGKILFSFNSFSITQDALLIGLKRGLILLSTVYISKLIFKLNFSLPGRLGKYLFKVFACLSLLSQGKKDITKKEKINLLSLVKRIDNHLLSIFSTAPNNPS